MKIIIKNKDWYSKYFIYNYLPRYLESLVEDEYRAARASQLKKELKLNIYNIFIYAMRNVSISESGDSYEISINKNIKYKDYNLKTLVDFITYGNLEIKGYKLLYDIFKLVNENIDIIYKEYEQSITRK